jgi:hypothetical protein
VCISAGKVCENPLDIADEREMLIGHLLEAR